jgi:hypothetical protein
MSVLSERMIHDRKVQVVVQTVAMTRKKYIKTAQTSSLGENFKNPK